MTCAGSIKALRWRGVMRQNVSDPTVTAPPEDRPCKRSKLRGFIYQSITDTTLSMLVTSQGHPRLNTASVPSVCVRKGGLGRRWHAFQLRSYQRGIKGGNTTSLSFVGVSERASERVKGRKKNGEKRGGGNNHQEIEIEHLESVPYSSSTLDIHKNPGLVIITIKKKKSPCLNMNLL